MNNSGNLFGLLLVLAKHQRLWEGSPDFSCSPLPTGSMANKSLHCILAPQPSFRQESSPQAGHRPWRKCVWLTIRKVSSRALLGCASQVQMQCSGCWLSHKDLKCCLSITTSYVLSAYPSSNLGVLVCFIIFWVLDMAADSI